MSSIFRYRLKNLPDKGQKIQLLYDRAVKALEMKSEIEIASSLLSALNLGSNNMNNLEWEGTTNGGKKADVLDSDDDEDPLAILTSSNSVNKNQIVVKHSHDDGREAQLITEDDIKEALEITNSPLHLDPVLEHICQNEKMEPSHRFLPHKPKYSSLNSSTSSLASSDEHKKIRDNTAASPPVYTQGTKLLTLRESIETQHAQRLKMKGLQEKQAVERLAMKAKDLSKVGPSPVADVTHKKSDGNFMSKYRLATSLLGDDFDVEENDSLSDENDDDN